MEKHRYSKGGWLGLTPGRFGGVFVALTVAVMDLRLGWALGHRAVEA